MPHRVANFFRSSTSSLENQISGFKKGNNSNSTHQRQSRSSERVNSYASSIEDVSDEAPPAVAKMEDHESSESHHNGGHHHHHRISLPGFHIGRSSKESHSHSSTKLELQIESPPIVFHGDAENSTGALVSGQLFLKVTEERLPLESFTATLNIHVTQKRPFMAACNDCTHQYTEVKTWNFLPAPLTLTKGMHAFPFSVLLGGHLPASLDGPLMSIAYEFKAKAVPKAGHGSPYTKETTLDVKRSLPTHENPHHSVRVFPPTNIKASVHFPQVIHPTGANTLSLRMDGIAKPNERNGTVEYWKLKKLTWRLEEISKTVAAGCDRHQAAAPSTSTGENAPKKGVERKDTRVIGERTFFSGWKSNYDSMEDASIEMELEYGVGKNFGVDPDPGHMHHYNAKEKKRYACDSKSADGSEVTHQLMVEMVVSQEWAPAGRPSAASQTGVGRILRMHFGSVLTERGGIGISWDNEAPPIYQDVPPSPPSYGGCCGDAAAEASASLEHAADVDMQMLDGEHPPAWSPSPTMSPELRPLDTGNDDELYRLGIMRDRRN